MILQYYGMLSSPHSWSAVSQSLLLEFQKQGIALRCKSTNGFGSIPPSLVPTCMNLNMPIKTEVSFSYTIPPNLIKIDAKHKIQIYNSDNDILPDGWASLMNSGAHLILPSSEFAKEIFLKNKVIEEKMVVVPHGYDPNLFNPNFPKLNIPEIDNSKFKFLCVSAPHYRKGIDVLIKAYIEEFKGDEDVVLIIKSSMNSHEVNAHFHVDIAQIAANLQKTHKYKWPEIKYINHRVESLASLYLLADAVVLSSRAECFSLTMLEASACQIPTITTDYGGHLDFLNHDNSYLIDYVMKACPKEGQYHQVKAGSLIAEPSHDDLKRLMRHVKNNPEEAKSKAMLAYSQVVDKYTWKSAADQILELIKEREWKL